MNGELADVSDPQVQSHAAFLHPADAGGPIPDLPADSPSCNFLREEKHCDRFRHLVQTELANGGSCDLFGWTGEHVAAIAADSEGVKLLMSLTDGCETGTCPTGFEISLWQGNSS
jgi:hypothetical protein